MSDPAHYQTLIQFMCSDDIEAYKIKLQFLLGTVIAGLAALLGQGIRSFNAKRRANQELIRELFLHIDELYRSSKQVKRSLRSRARVTWRREWLMDSQIFSSQMDELSRIQLSLEQCWQTIRSRSDLLPGTVREAIGDLLGYSESYLHDVVEEFEKRIVRKQDSDYVIHSNCPMLLDFIGERYVPEVLEPYVKTIRSGKSTLKDKQLAIDSVNTLRREAKKNGEKALRFKKIFEESLLAVIGEMREYASGQRLKRFELPERRAREVPSGTQ